MSDRLARVGSDSPCERPLGFWSTTALVVGHTIGVGIFLTPAELIGALGAPALTFALWIACGIVVLCGALTFGELASRFPRTGGLYVYLREAFGPRFAFLYGWLCLLIVDPGVVAALAVGLSQYAVVVWPASAGWEKVLAVGLVWALSVLTMTGLRPTLRFVNGLMIGKILALLAVSAGAVAASSGSWSHLVPFFERRAGAPPLRDALALGLVSVFFSFGGFWEPSRVAGETRDPQRTLPRALALGVTAVTLVYVATTVAFLYLVPSGSVTSSADFARRAGEVMLGRAGPVVLAVIVMISAMASAAVLLLVAPRVYIAMSRDGLFSGTLAKVHPVTKAPVRATALLASMATLLILSGSFQQILAFFLCPTLVLVALSASALFVVRRLDTSTPAFRTPGYPATPAAFVLLAAAVVLLVAVARPVPALSGFALVLAGLPVYGVLRSRSGGL